MNFTDVLVSDMRTYTVTSVKEGTGVFRLVSEDPKKPYNGKYNAYDKKYKWSWSVTVLPVVGSQQVRVPVLAPVFIAPASCAGKTCTPNQVMSPIDCTCSDFLTFCPLKCSAGLIQRPDCACV